MEQIFMGNLDFTYEVPEDFCNRVFQYLKQYGKDDVGNAFKRSEYECEDVGLAYYAGLIGDNWNKKAIDITIEGLDTDINLLKSNNSLLKDAIGKSLRSSVSGYLVRDVFYLSADTTVFENERPSSNEERLNADISTANKVLEDLIKISERVCLSHTYNGSSSENVINDFFRDMLFGMGYKEIKDQTRHGVSSSGKDAGEVDILLTKDNKEIAIFEGLKLDSIRSDYIDVHINKVINNYNALGTATFLIAYVSVADFEAFWFKYVRHIDEYPFNLSIKKKLDVLAHPNASTRVATMILTRDGYDFPVYYLALKIR